MTGAEGDASDVVVALATAPDAEAAARIGRALVQERLVACTNLVPGMTSIYRWRGEVREEGEVLMVMKTRGALVDRLKARLPELHPYEVPELLVVPVTDGLEAYCRWVRDETDG